LEPEDISEVPKSPPSELADSSHEGLRSNIDSYENPEIEIELASHSENIVEMKKSQNPRREDLSRMNSMTIPSTRESMRPEKGNRSIKRAYMKREEVSQRRRSLIRNR